MERLKRLKILSEQSDVRLQERLAKSLLHHINISRKLIAFII